jgi:hypothetical protein
MTNPTPPRTLSLHDLPLAARLTLALFLVSVGLGYFSALINLHFQSASPGEALPTAADAVAGYSGKAGMSQLERLLTAHPSLPFNGQGSMQSAFTRRRIGPGAFKRAVQAKAKVLNKTRATKLDPGKPADRSELERAVQEDLHGERHALIAWVRAGANKDAYENDSFPLPDALANHPISAEFEETDNKQRIAKIKSIFDARCVRCHSESVGGAASRFPLDTYEQIEVYTTQEASTGKSLSELALTTHVHLLGFSMLYGLTGLVLAFSSYPWFLRAVLCPLPLLAQVVDISFWWLARLAEPYGPLFAKAIVVSGAVVGASLFLHIVLGLADLFGKGRLAKLVLVLLLCAAAAGTGFVVKQRVIDPYLAQEKPPAAVP